MIDLFDQEIYQDNRKSSKGNQLKWQKEDTWYKADYCGYEGLVEYVVSKLLRFSNLNENEYVIYETEQIRYGDKIYNGCKSTNFLKEDESLITLERLFKNRYGQSLYQSIFKITDINKRKDFIVNNIKMLTNLQDFDKYLSKTLTIDALFLNEDRHMHNIAVIRKNDGTFDYCPIFDNGACLLSDTIMDYPLHKDVFQLMKKVKSKTISTDFDEQLEAIDDSIIKFLWNRNDLINILNNEQYYDDSTKERVYDILMAQKNKYSYLFKWFYQS